MTNMEAKATASPIQHEFYQKEEVDNNVGLCPFISGGYGNPRGQINQFCNAHTAPLSLAALGQGLVVYYASY